MLECSVLTGSWDYLKAAEMTSKKKFRSFQSSTLHLLGYYSDNCPFVLGRRSHSAGLWPNHSSLENSFSGSGVCWVFMTVLVWCGCLELRTKCLDKENVS